MTRLVLAGAIMLAGAARRNDAWPELSYDAMFAENADAVRFPSNAEVLEMPNGIFCRDQGKGVITLDQARGTVPVVSVFAGPIDSYQRACRNHFGNKPADAVGQLPYAVMTFYAANACTCPTWKQPRHGMTAKLHSCAKKIRPVLSADSNIAIFIDGFLSKTQSVIDQMTAVPRLPAAPCF
jgi:hypothetical protein